MQVTHDRHMECVDKPQSSQVTATLFHNTDNLNSIISLPNPHPHHLVSARFVHRWHQDWRLPLERTLFTSLAYAHSVYPDVN